MRGGAHPGQVVIPSKGYTDTAHTLIPNSGLWIENYSNRLVFCNQRKMLYNTYSQLSRYCGVATGEGGVTLCCSMLQIGKERGSNPGTFPGL